MILSLVLYSNTLWEPRLGDYSYRGDYSYHKGIAHLGQMDEVTL